MQDIKSALVYMYIIAAILGGIYIYINVSKTRQADPPNVDINAWTGVAQENMLDYQFSESNRPLIIYKDMFTRSAPWIGGYDIAIGKTIMSKAQQK